MKRPGGLLHGVWISLALMLVGLVAGAALLPIDQVVRAPGMVLATELASPQWAPLAGRIAQVHVKEGDRVRRGERLVTIAPEPSLPALDEARLRWVRASALHRAYAGPAALPSDAATPEAPEPDDEAIALAVARSVEAERAQRLAQRLAQERDVSEAEAALAVEEAGRRRAWALLPLAQEKLARHAKLALEGFFSETALLALRQELVESQEQAALAEARVLRASEDLARRRATQALLLAEQHRTWAERSEEAQQSHLLARRELLRLRQLHAGGAVEAPIDGVIEQVSPQLAGNILRAGDRLMAIAPDAARYEIQLRVRNEDFPFVQVGQAVEVKFDAFPYTVHGTWPAQVLRLIREPLASPEGISDYTVVAGFAGPVGPKGLAAGLPPLRTGMKVQADIVVGSRLPLEIWLDPFIRLGREALREHR
jgi:hemolysin D